MNDLTAEDARKFLDYDPETGLLMWKVGRPGVGFGKTAGYFDSRGCSWIRIHGKRYAAHRLVWLIVYGEWPSLEIDHRNGNPQDNRLANLRLATRSQNNANSARRKEHTSGYKGVRPHRGKWQALIAKDKKQYFLGTFKTAEAAHIAYYQAAKELYGEFARAA